jgi:8-oxo-dGTP pyrophosphatase MutT (NUDIX family)
MIGLHVDVSPNPGSSLAALETLLRQKLGEPLPGAAAQWRFAPVPPRKGWMPELVPEDARHAAALILLYPGPDDILLPLTVRRDDLPHHPGQVSLPGGGLDPGEPADQAALRETYEEIGVAPDSVRIIGALSTLWVVVSGFVVTPFVALADARPSFTLAPREVAALIEAPLSQLRDPARLGWQKVRVREGMLIDYPYFDLAGHRVWGATAMMLGEFACLFNPDHCPPRLR